MLFRSGIAHWRKKYDREEYPRYRPGQVREIADNVLLYQRADGGWPCNLDPTRILEEKERRAIAAEKGKRDASFDNRNSYTQTEYLARAFGRTGDERCRDGCRRGLEYILAAQYDNGGFPHSWPKPGGYYPHVTIVDDVMVGVLATLRRAAAGAEPFGFLDRKSTRLNSSHSSVSRMPSSA
mgnify:CR=1 FL=1